MMLKFSWNFEVLVSNSGYAPDKNHSGPLFIFVIIHIHIDILFYVYLFILFIYLFISYLKLTIKNKTDTIVCTIKNSYAAKYMLI